jgi:hypothetical protein
MGRRAASGADFSKSVAGDQREPHTQSPAQTQLGEMMCFSSALTGHATSKDIVDLKRKMTLPMAALCDPGPGEARKARFPSFLTSTVLSLPIRMAGPLTQKRVATHRILAVLLDDIEMLRDRFMRKQGALPKVSDGFRRVVGTAERQRLKETAAV